MELYNTEKEILEVFTSRFSRFEDFYIVNNYKLGTRHNTMRPDIIISYAERTIAIVEIKKLKGNVETLKKGIIKQLNYYRDKFNCMFFFSIIEDKFYSYDTEKGLSERNEKEVFDLLIKAVDDNSVSCNELVTPMRGLIKQNVRWEKFNRVLQKYIKKGNLQKFGNCVFLSRDSELSFMSELLWMGAKYDKKMFCRYTSAESFFLSLKNQFRIMDVDAMNDELETKVINNFPNLLKVKRDLADYTYNGFIMCFSAMSRHDKLFNWYMYGDRAKGVCFTVTAKEQGDNSFLAPVIYISPTEKTVEMNHLNFLNELMGFRINDQVYFKLRLWHYWKYFFKYDYYKEEEEIRLLLIDKGKEETGWSEEFNIPFLYIEKKLEDLPFSIIDVTVGPKYKSKDNLWSIIDENVKNACTISDSKIVGYR